MINLTKSIFVVINSHFPCTGRTSFLIHDVAVRVLVSVLARPRQRKTEAADKRLKKIKPWDFHSEEASSASLTACLVPG